MQLIVHKIVKHLSKEFYIIIASGVGVLCVGKFLQDDINCT